MNKLPSSIFNDVIGPIMRGPSSSHVAGASRIAAIVRQSLNNDVKKVIVDFDVNGSLASSHDGHGTDMGFVSGILGLPVTDPNVANYVDLAAKAG
ncbi:MAG: serine dehydratase, partial [Synergistaceae bacterium]|nr:serine dehydratase [Synergistaceae bacterium]